MENLIILIIFYFLIYDFFRCLVTFFLKDTAHKKNIKTSDKNLEKIFILLPAYREQRIVEPIINYWDNITKQNKNLEVYMITTSREERERDLINKDYKSHETNLKSKGFRLEDLRKYNYDKHNINHLKTTSELIEQELNSIKERRSLHLLKYKGKEIGKSSQLDYAISHLHDLKYLKGDSYIGIYDFDSRPDFSVFDEVSKFNLNDIKPDILQQSALPVLNLKNSSKFAICDAYHHLIRTYFNEVMIWKSWNKLDNWPKFRSCIMSLYCVGIGLYIKSSYLKEVFNDKFPTPVDDLPIGFKSSEQNIQIRHLKAPCFIESYPDLPSSINSRKLVLYAYAERLIKKTKKPISFIMDSISRGFIFVILGPLFVVALLFTLKTKDEWLLFLIAIILYIITSVIKLLLGYKIAKKYNINSPYPKLIHFVISLFVPISRCISAYYSISAAFKLLIFNKKAKFEKTVRH